MPLSGVQGWNDFLAAGPRDDGTISPQLAFAGVPFIYRAVNLRAYALASLPFSLSRGTRELDKEGEEYVALANQIKRWLFAIEANLCIFGAAYLLIEKNQYGQNPTPRPVLPSTITPMYDMPFGELAYFERVTNGVSMRIELEDILHFWLHSFQHENAPGTSPLGACLGSAATLHNLGRFAQQFFANGALMPTVFFFGDGASGMPSTTTPQEIETFLERMKRVVSGIKNAWKFEALRGNVSAQQIGTPPSDVAAPDLTNIARQDVAVSFGIPESLLLSTSSTYASASADMYHVYDLTVIPEADAVILPTLQRWLDTIGLTLTWQPEMLESYQSYQQHQAMSIGQLVGEPILTRDEGRATLGYGPMENENEDVEVTSGQDTPLTETILNSGALSVNELRERLGLEPVDTSEDEEQRKLSRQLDLLKKAIDAGLSQEVAAALVGLELPELEEDATTPPSLDEQPLISPSEENSLPFESTQGEIEEEENVEAEEELIAIRALSDLVAEQTEAIKQLAQQEEVADLELLFEEVKALTAEQDEVKHRGQPRDRLGRFTSSGGGGGGGANAGGSGGSAAPNALVQGADDIGNMVNRGLQNAYNQGFDAVLGGARQAAREVIGEFRGNSSSYEALGSTASRGLETGARMYEAHQKHTRKKAARKAQFDVLYKKAVDKSMVTLKKGVNLGKEALRLGITISNSVMNQVASNTFNPMEFSQNAHTHLASLKYSSTELDNYFQNYQYTTGVKSLPEGDDTSKQAKLTPTELEEFKAELNSQVEELNKHEEAFLTELRVGVYEPIQKLIEFFENYDNMITELMREQNMERPSDEPKSIDPDNEPPEIQSYP